MIAIRGAIVASGNTPEAISEATGDLFRSIVEKNQLTPHNVVAIWTSCTRDLDQQYPGETIRNMGMDVPILCLQEQYVEGSLPLCIRMMILADILGPASHIYIGRARKLRADLFGGVSCEN